MCFFFVVVLFLDKTKPVNNHLFTQYILLALICVVTESSYLPHFDEHFFYLISSLEMLLIKVAVFLKPKC